MAFLVAGGAAYLAYRKQRTADLSHALATRSLDSDALSELRTRFATAVEQLSHTSAAVRMAGAYALATIADEWLERDNVPQAQMCVEVLCGYLRLPYKRDSGKNFQTKRVVKRNLDDKVSEEEHFEFPQNDRAVRATITGIVAQRLMSKGGDWDPRPWARLSLDFTDAHLVDAYFFSSVFPRMMIFRRTRFEGMAVFALARFELAIFEQCTFESDAIFSGAHFAEHLQIVGAPFVAESGEPSDESADVLTRVGGRAMFADAVFDGGVKVSDTEFQSAVTFAGATFNQVVGFDGIDGQEFDFSEAKFKDGGMLQNVVSVGEVTFKCPV
ncbi:pentapeptide repeat-containing protein [Rhodococcus sp. USK13]|uniref:pentapeptide repeat-containing protein n=1 Tax=Rhodococcus sp. USK13 TaxID=2806442 RepID=UPI001BCFE61A|nr:pentapeptide repeat-containing protein [Rhodococcus sp. USK13]